MKLGAQLFTLRNYIQTEKDIEITLQKVARIGYKTVQVSAIGKIAPERLREICDNNGLEIAITHTDPQRILNDTENVIKEHDILGCKYIGIGAMPEKYWDAEWIGQFAADYLEPAKKIAGSGKLLMYHNHNFEFKKVNGKKIIDTLIEGFRPEEMGFTLDTYWVQAGGADIMDWLEILKDRIPCVHLKDMAVEGWASIMAPVMEGNINFPKILKRLEELNCTEHILVEQDVCKESPFKCLETSYKNLNTLGYR